MSFATSTAASIVIAPTFVAAASKRSQTPLGRVASRNSCPFQVRPCTSGTELFSPPIPTWHCVTQTGARETRECSPGNLHGSAASSLTGAHRREPPDRQPATRRQHRDQPPPSLTGRTSKDDRSSCAPHRRPRSRRSWRATRMGRLADPGNSANHAAAAPTCCRVSRKRRPRPKRGNSISASSGTPRSEVAEPILNWKPACSRREPRGVSSRPQH